MTFRIEREEALQLAIMLQAGMPSSDAIRYFAASQNLDQTQLRELHDEWLRSPALAKAILTLQRKPWQEMSLDEKIHYSLDLHYASLAYFLYSHNYTEVSAQDKAKSDTARQVLEAKLAGLSGKSDALSRFFADITSGVIKLDPQNVSKPS